MLVYFEQSAKDYPYMAEVIGQLRKAYKACGEPTRPEDTTTSIIEVKMEIYAPVVEHLLAEAIKTLWRLAGYENVDGRWYTCREEEYRSWLTYRKMATEIVRAYIEGPMLEQYLESRSRPEKGKRWIKS